LAGTGHQPWPHPHHPLPSGQQVASSRPVTCRQSSTAHIRRLSPGQRVRAQPTSSPCPSVRAGTVVWSSCRPAWSTTTTVWDRAVVHHPSGRLTHHHTEACLLDLGLYDRVAARRGWTF
jgi:hypothetical protein